jgi:hypothetical protein
MHKSEDDKLVEEVRGTLLQHFSSKSTLQATILLSLAITFFAFIQTIPLFEKLNPSLLCLFYSLVLTTFTFLTIRAFGRLIYWGAMAGLVERKSIDSEEKLKKEFEEKKEGQVIPPCLYRLESACNEDLGKSRVHHIFHKWTNERGGSIASFLIIFALFVSVFSYQFQILDAIDATVIGVIVTILTFLAFLVYLKYIKKERGLFAFSV